LLLVELGRYLSYMMKRSLWLLMLGIIMILPAWPRTETHQWYFPSGGSWEPSERVIQEIKPTMELQIKELAKQAGRRLEPWERHSFQVQGQEENGKQYVYVNTLCRPTVQLCCPNC
jgi:hypothetical protein